MTNMLQNFPGLLCPTEEIFANDASFHRCPNLKHC